MTGSTGAIGKEVLKEFKAVETRLILLVRNPEKIKAQLAWADQEFKERIKVVKGDLKEPRLGLAEIDYQLVLTADVLIHAGGTMDVLLDEQAAKEVFANGARSLIEVAKDIQQQKGLSQFIHVVGYMSPFNDSDGETEADVWQMDDFMKHGNAYERYKFLADLYVRQQARLLGFPLSVVNPSTVVGGYPTGATEQLAGFGYLVNASRRKLMPVIPGGKKYWLPFVTDKLLAKLIVQLAQAERVVSQTYTLTPNKSEALNMVALNQLIARELQVAKPRITLPVPVLTTVLKAGIGKLLDIPAETLAFVTQESFDNRATIKLAEQLGISNLGVNELLPNVIADLDYRFTFPQQLELAEFSREVADKTIYFKKEGIGTPWVIIHGVFSDAVELSALALMINSKLGNPVYVIDLPGLGHSPIVAESPRVNDFVESIKKVIQAIGAPVNLLGHSMGANLAAKVATIKELELEEVVLIQPLTKKNSSHPLVAKITQQPKLLKLILKRLSKKSIKKYLLASGSFIAGDVKLADYSERMYHSLASPRMLATNANLMALIEHEAVQITWEDLPRKTTVLWGELDKVYLAPSQTIYPVHYMAAGHQLPIAAPEKVVEVIRNL